MIVTCSQCSTRYLVPTQALGAQGRLVRCSICSNEWHQTPDETFSAAMDEVQASPDSVKPIPQGSELPAILAEPVVGEGTAKKKDRPSLQAQIAGYAAALVVFIGAIAGLFVFHDKVMAAWPESTAFYQAFGMVEDVPGEGLVFDSVKAVLKTNLDGTKMLTVDGKILNIKTKDVAVPDLRFALRAEGGIEKDNWVSPSPVKTLAPKQEAAFSINYEMKGDDLKEVNVRFIMKQ